tara:strand:- start:8855 stop:12073 length:3219 start_codon:yes stop_codon:yes gene_type:complete
MRFCFSLAIAALFFSGLQSFAQDSPPTGTALLDKLLSEEKTKEAKKTLYDHLKYLKEKDLIDSLAHYAYYVGKIEMLETNKKNAQTKAESYVSDYTLLTSKPEALRQIHMSMAGFYDLLGMPHLGYKSNEEALKYSLQITNASGSSIGAIQSNLGTSAMRLGNMKLAIEHFRKTLKYYKQDPETEPTDLYFGYSSMGAAMYYTSKVDSSIYYYEKAVKQVSTLDSTPLNLYYRPALLLNNVAGLYSIEGQTTKSLEAMSRSLELYNDFLKSDAEDYKKKNALKGKFQAIDNIAGIYQSLGDYYKAHELLLFSYNEKQKEYDDDNPELFKSMVLLGQSEILLLNFEAAASYLDEGIARIKTNPGAFLYWDADAHYSRAKVYDALGNKAMASTFYTKSEDLYDKAFAENYDKSYLDFIKTASLFYAENNEKQKAVSISKKGYDYVIKHQGNNTLTAFAQTLNLGEVYFKLNNFSEALRYSDRALESLSTAVKNGESKLDSISIEFQKPAALLLNVKSQYKLNNNRDTLFLINLYKQLNNAVDILEKRKTNISDAKSVNLLISENNEVYNFAKKIALELYKKTNNKAYLNKTIGYHESNIYNRIRTRLNGKEALRFNKVPARILARENSLKRQLNTSLTNAEGGIEVFLKATEEWDEFKEDLKTQFPDYYHMRYAKITESLDEIRSKIPKETTLIKYFFIEDELNALVLTKEKYSHFQLDAQQLKSNIEILQVGAHDQDNILQALHTLYLKLWEPFESEITTKNVRIIPDQILYNLNFEALTPTKVDSFKELASSSLLSLYYISYDFSLEFSTEENNVSDFTDNYIGFAPGFSEKMKKDYQTLNQDSEKIDINYLTLLPQPFSIDLIISAKELMGGKMFLNEASTEDKFKENAHGHKIIHIGTHAESNNISPELSRLIFAKNGVDSTDNYLYNYEIYNCDLSANLAILTACETGKPSYQPGEGMISLAHAFTYAGSESMLTSLWKIDEKSSTQIIEKFYEFLSEGLPKNEALQKAKLSYLASAEGRTLAPQYWAGMVLIGDTSPVALNTGWHWGIWLVIGLVLLTLFITLLKRKA